VRASIRGAAVSRSNGVPKLPVDVPSQFCQSLVEHRLRDFLIVLRLDRRVRLEVEAVGEVVAHGVATAWFFFLPQLHPGPRPTGPPAEADVVRDAATLSIAERDAMPVFTPTTFFSTVKSTSGPSKHPMPCSSFGKGKSSVSRARMMFRAT